MRKVTLIQEEKEQEFILLTKDEIAVFLAVMDKNPRSHWVWIDYDSVSLWGAAATRVMRCTASVRKAREWFRIPVKALKDLKILKKDALLVRHPHQDVVELTKVRPLEKSWVLDEGAALETQAGAEVTVSRVSVPPPGTTDYTLDTLEGALGLNTGKPVPRTMLSPAHLDPLVKLDVATGKKCEVSLTAGFAGVPCLFELKNPQDGCVWVYALMPRGKKA